MRLPEPEGILLALTCCLAGVGVVMVYSSDWVSSVTPKGSTSALLKHLFALGLGTGLMLGLIWFNYKKLESLWYVWLAIAIVGLVAVLVPGIGTLQNGARRWIRLGPMVGFQPSEFAKLAMVLFIAGWASRHQERMHEFLRGFLIPCSAVVTLAGLTVLEPDFGTAGFIAFLGMMLLVIAGCRWFYVAAAGLVSIPGFMFLIHQAAYRKARVLAFLDPWKDASGSGYHIIQSWVAFGSGGVWGEGLGNGHQKLFFLPECSGDFIFATLGEELGFIGAFSVILLFGLLGWQGLRVSLKAGEPFGEILAMGLTLMLCFQAAFNIAVVLGCVPTKGIPLPFISSGGSSLMLSMAAVGLLLSIAKHSKEEGEKTPSWKPGQVVGNPLRPGSLWPGTVKDISVKRRVP